MLDIKKSLILWVIIISAIVMLVPAALNLKFSNLNYRSNKGEKRHLVETSRFPMNTVGRLLLPNGICSATLINERILITASHCFWQVKKETGFKGFFRKPKMELLKPQAVIFQLERNGKLLNVSSLKRIQSDAPEPDALMANQKTLSRDYAFAELEKPINKKLYGINKFATLASSTPAVNSKLWQAGYGPDKNNHLMGDNACQIVKIHDYNIIQHNCLITMGDSGGPIFIEINGSWQLIGINSYLEGLSDVLHAFAIGPENYYKPLSAFITTP